MAAKDEKTCCSTEAKSSSILSSVSIVKSPNWGFHKTQTQPPQRQIVVTSLKNLCNVIMESKSIFYLTAIDQEIGFPEN